MNITTDLHYAFFTLKNRRSQNDQKLSLGPAPGDENELYEQTEEEKYKLFEPSINYFLGIYLSIIGMSNISVVSMGFMGSNKHINFEKEGKKISILGSLNFYTYNSSALCNSLIEQKLDFAPFLHN